jgi:hypothetical protein
LRFLLQPDHGSFQIISAFAVICAFKSSLTFAPPTRAALIAFYFGVPSLCAPMGTPFGFWSIPVGNANVGNRGERAVPATTSTHLREAAAWSSPAFRRLLIFPVKYSTGTWGTVASTVDPLIL